MTTAATSKATETPGKERKFGGAVYYDVTRAADYMGVHPSTLKRETKNKHITHMKLGRDIWYKPVWIDDYLSERTKIGVFKQ